jgi:hypothetical protein
VLITSASNHRRRNSPNIYPSPLFTELFKWNTTMAEPERTTLRRRKYSVYGRNKDQKSKRFETLLHLPLLLMFLCGAHTLAPPCQQIMNKRPTIPRIIFTADIQPLPNCYCYDHPAETSMYA